MAGRDGDARQGGVALGTVLGAPVVVSGWWFAVAAFITVVFAPAYRTSHPDLPTGSEYVLAGALVLLLYLSVFLHELGHAVAARAFGIPVVRVRLDVLGGLTEMTRPAGTPGREAVVAGAGPAVSVVLAVVGVLAYLGAPDGSVVRLLLGQLAAVNVFVSVFNLLPGLPLDGGTLLRSALWALTGARSTATVAAAWAGRVVAVVTALLPFVLAWLWGGRPSLLSAVWFLVIAASVWTGSSAALLQERLRATVARLSVAGLVRPALAVGPDEPVSAVVDRVVAGGAGGAVVVDPYGRPVAVLSETAVSATPPERRPHVAARTVARQVAPEDLLVATDDGERLLAVVAGSPAAEHVVVGTDGRLAGLVLVADVDRAMQAGARPDGR